MEDLERDGMRKEVSSSFTELACKTILGGEHREQDLMCSLSQQAI